MARGSAKVDNTATLGFEAKLWHAADLMRGKLPATQYRQVLMGLLFLRYVSDAFENRYRELKAEGYGDEEDRDAYMEKMKRLTGELGELFGESARLEAAIRKNLKAIGYEV